MNPVDEMPPGWPVIRERTYDGGHGRATAVFVEPPIDTIEIRSRQWWLDGYRVAKAGIEITCCGLAEAEHPTYPTASGHEFGMHHWLFRGCAACVQFARDTAPMKDGIRYDDRGEPIPPPAAPGGLDLYAHR